jgi:hypothetical protein
MGGEALKLKLARPQLARWDLVALGILAGGAVLMGANWQVSQARASGAGGLTSLFVFAQLLVCLGSLFVLGKTAKEGTFWGNVAAVAGMFVGMGGVLLAAALWAAA